VGVAGDDRQGLLVLQTLQCRPKANPNHARPFHHLVTTTKHGWHWSNIYKVNSFSSWIYSPALGLPSFRILSLLTPHLPPQMCVPIDKSIHPSTAQEATYFEHLYP
jgi:hypothetical protein